MNFTLFKENKSTHFAALNFTHKTQNCSKNLSSNKWLFSKISLVIKPLSLLLLHIIIGTVMDTYILQYTFTNTTSFGY